MESKINVDIEGKMREFLVANELEMAALQEKLLFFENVEERDVISRIIKRSLSKFIVTNNSNILFDYLNIYFSIRRVFNFKNRDSRWTVRHAFCNEHNKTS